MPQEGVLLQMDGSHHAWLGDRGPMLTLLLAIDDATGTPPYALFREQEDTEGYFELLKGIIESRHVGRFPSASTRTATRSSARRAHCRWKLARIRSVSPPNSAAHCGSSA